MALSKDDLRRALQGEEETFDIVPNRFSEAVEALNEGTLEIEGYERAQWTKFNPNDPKTFPPKGKFMYFDGFGIAIGIHLQCERKDGFVHVYRKITHLRPLPKPPQETEEVK